MSNDDFVPTGDAQLDAIERFFREAEAGVTIADNFRAGVEVEEYENDSLYSGFSKVARAAGYEDLANLFTKVAGEEKLHAVWMREADPELTARTFAPGAPESEAAKAIRGQIAEQEALVAEVSRRVHSEPALRRQVAKRMLHVAISVENIEANKTYPEFAAAAHAAGNKRLAAMYERVMRSEAQHHKWYSEALQKILAAPDPAFA
ncbi:MAG TPA: ferritin family protein [Candidatus Thermoplasmatota archaeon]|nr:ferritin family protein [Candidatus Thermoplasmatota archaeon]